MEKNPLPCRKIVFVCTHERVPGERTCCGPKGGIDFHAALKDMVAERGLHTRIRVSRSGCMDRCESGTNLIVLPDNAWYSDVSEADLEELVDGWEAEIGSSRRTTSKD